MRIEKRIDILSLLPEGAVCVELGVAQGNFSVEILSHPAKVKRLFSVDRWSGERGHDDQEYLKAWRRLDLFGERSIVLRMDFGEARKIFNEDVFDFIYIDGYAHQGQAENCLEDWWSKLKPGGIYAGHDYAENWPLTMKTVDAFAEGKNLEINLTSEEIDVAGMVYPSWWTIKPE